MNKKSKPSNTSEGRFFGWVTVSSKGQLAIPKKIRRQLNIKSGDKLLVVIRKGKDGINLIKANVLDSLLEKLSE